MNWLNDIPDAVEQLVVHPLQELVKDATNTVTIAMAQKGESKTGSDDSRYNEEEDSSSLEEEKCSYSMIRDAVAVESSMRGGAELLLFSSSSTPASTTNNNITTNNSQNQHMILRVLRGKHLPNESFQIKIYHSMGSKRNSVNIDKSSKLDGSPPEEEQHLIGTLDGDGDSHNSAINWGGSSNRWSLTGNNEDELVFQLKICRQQEDNAEDRTATTIHVSTNKVSELLFPASQHPNVWIRLVNDASPDRDHASIQVRLGLAQHAPLNLHPQQNCPRLSPGPGLSAPFTSYRIRKEALWSCSPVMLNVYDVSTNQKIETINQYTKAVGAGGIFHAAIEVFGKEYSFGGTSNKRSFVTGVFSCPPKQCPMHHYRESVYLGDCELNQHQLEAILADLRPGWLAHSYNLFRKNCCFFSQELALDLGVGDIPAWVYSLATTAEFIEPYAIKLNQYLNERARAKNASGEATSTTAAAVTTEKAKTTDSADKTEYMPEVAASEEVLLDHAMAARIQRSFRFK